MHTTVVADGERPPNRPRTKFSTTDRTLVLNLVAGGRISIGTRVGDDFGIDFHFWNELDMMAPVPEAGQQVRETEFLRK